MVTLLHAVRSPGKIETFTFLVDESETRLSVFITGTKAFTLISPSGAVQETITGSLTTGSPETVGNLLVLTLKHEAGQWIINMRSTEPYTLNIKAQSSVSFFIRFMESSEVRSDGYSVKTNQPTAEGSGTLMVVPFGKDAITLKEVNLVYSSTSGQSRGNITGQENNEYLVQFDKIPSEGFTVQVKLEENSGLTKSTSPSYQRQSTANIKPLLISVTASSPATVEPGSTIYTNITVSARDTEGKFTIKATLTPDVGSINSSFTLEVLRNSSTNAIIQSTIASTTAFGTEVIQTVEVKGLSASDSTYAVSTFTVTKEHYSYYYSYLLTTFTTHYYPTYLPPTTTSTTTTPTTTYFYYYFYSFSYYSYYYYYYFLLPYYYYSTYYYFYYHYSYYYLLLHYYYYYYYYYYYSTTTTTPTTTTPTTPTTTTTTLLFLLLLLTYYYFYCHYHFTYCYFYYSSYYHSTTTTPPTPSPTILLLLLLLPLLLLLLVHLLLLLLLSYYYATYYYFYYHYSYYYYHFTYYYFYYYYYYYFFSYYSYYFYYFYYHYPTYYPLTTTYTITLPTTTSYYYSYYHSYYYSYYYYFTYYYFYNYFYYYIYYSS
ncbi:hypothetical protein WMY93_024738 [Mugilogobius chulae]|uniref:Uncharacterized protein n=1 Tax=Mugilogobius chulae TaxID=88201 RepID=A0AAW0N1G6_9GOBI